MIAILITVIIFTTISQIYFSSTKLEKRISRLKEEIIEEFEKQNEETKGEVRLMIRRQWSDIKNCVKRGGEEMFEKFVDETVKDNKEILLEEM